MGYFLRDIRGIIHLVRAVRNLLRDLNNAKPEES